MENTFNDIDELIGKYLSGETTSEENTLVERWIGENDKNRNYFNQFKLIFDRAATVKEIQQFDTDEAWKKLRSKLNKKPAGKVVEMKPSATHWVMRVAASIVIVIGVGFFLYRMMDTAENIPSMQVATKASTASDTLPDGSGVFLNKQSQLAYAFDKKSKAHKVKLKGEAFFKIEHKEDKTFIVEAEDVLVKDIGTSFNVKAYAETNTVEVFVEEGEVILYTESNEGIHVHADEKGVYHKDTKTFTLEKPEPNVVSYKSKVFVFAGSNLQSIVDNLNDVYDRKIKIQPHLAYCSLTVSFNEENIDEIAQVIAETLGLTVTQDGNDILLEGKACEN